MHVSSALRAPRQRHTQADAVMRLRGAGRAATAAATAAAATATAAATAHPFDPFTNRFADFPLVMTNMAHIDYRPDGSIVLREMRDIGPGLLISKERADALYSDTVVDELKAIFNAVTASNTGERAGGAGSASTRLTYTETERKVRKLTKAAASSHVKQNKVVRTQAAWEEYRLALDKRGLLPLSSSWANTVIVREEMYEVRKKGRKEEGRSIYINYISNTVIVGEEMYEVRKK